MGEKQNIKKVFKIRGNEKNKIKKREKYYPKQKNAIILKFINSVTLLGEINL